MVIVLTGAPASGKSTVAERLASCLDRAAHIQVDFFRKIVKGGYASPQIFVNGLIPALIVGAGVLAVGAAAALFVPALSRQQAETGHAQPTEELAIAA